MIGLLIGTMGLPAALATVSVLAAVAAGPSLSVAPERDALTDRVGDAFDAGRAWAVAGLTPATITHDQELTSPS